ncbi:integrase [Gallibacterium salpingitidis]|uniref:tyrosine-type recombinase/integrase n=1 Tax=Gallibacterium salpingitidis TaxID=505341 RepID=UPI0008052F9A|nr:site-specific integrase [Gallibacterium salpingitidis]OBX06654.1 integrase [Gallibacterium salpingitidis]
MATFIKRNNTWRVQIRRKGISRSAQFRTKAEAQAWALEIEGKIFNGDFSNIPNITFSDLIDKYIKEVSINKRSYKNEVIRLTRLSNRKIGEIRLRDLDEYHFHQWKEERMKEVSVATVLREWNTLSHLLNTAVTEWKFLKENPLKNLKRPSPPPERTRRLSDEEIQKILFVADYDIKYMPLTIQNRVAAAMLFAIETAMRAGEICNAKWQDYHPEKRLLYLPQTKNGHPRNVPLSSFAIEIIQQMQKVRTEDTDLIFQLKASQLDANFRKLKAKAALDDMDLHFHDTRREALTRLAKKVDVMTLAKISGHRDIKILLNTYYAPNMVEVVKLLD